MAKPRVATVDVLRRARALIAKPECWTKGTYARDRHGRSNSAAAEAVRWCADGAIRHVTGVVGTSWSPDDPVDQRYQRYVDSCDALERVLPGGIATVWNDHPSRTHAEVLEAFDRAIALKEKRHG